MRLLLSAVMMGGTLGCLLAQSYDDIFNNARLLLKQERYSDAVIEGRKAIALDRSRWQGYYVTATAYSGMNQCDAALPYFQSALDRSVPEQIKMTIDRAVAECETLLRASPAVSAPIPAVGQSTAQRQQVATSVQQTSFKVLHEHRFNYGPGVLTIGPTVTFIETIAGPTLSDLTAIYPKDQFSVPLNQVTFTGYRQLKRMEFADIDGQTWEERTGKTLSTDVIVLDVAGKKWELQAPNKIAHDLVDTLNAMQGRRN